MFASIAHKEPKEVFDGMTSPTASFSRKRAAISQPEKLHGTHFELEVGIHLNGFIRKMHEYARCALHTAKQTHCSQNETNSLSKSCLNLWCCCSLALHGSKSCHSASTICWFYKHTDVIKWMTMYFVNFCFINRRFRAKVLTNSWALGTHTLWNILRWQNMICTKVCDVSLSV